MTLAPTALRLSSSRSSLERRSAQTPFRIAHHEDDVQINSTLLEFLKRDFDLRIPELENELPRDRKR